MAVVFMNAGLDKLTQIILRKLTAVDYKVHLYVNNLTPLVTSVIGDFTECTLAGYAAASLTGGNWTGSTTGGVATYNYPAIAYTFSAYAGGTTIYGYYVSDSSSTYAIWAELFGTSFAVPAGGGELDLSLQWVDKLC